MNERKTKITPGLLAELDPLLFRHEPRELAVVRRCPDCGRVTESESLTAYKGTLKSLAGKELCRVSCCALCECNDPRGRLFLQRDELGTPVSMTWSPSRAGA